MIGKRLFCEECREKLDRRGLKCQSCVSKVYLKNAEQTKLDHRRFVQWKQNMSVEELKKLSDEVMKKLLEEEDEL